MKKAPAPQTHEDFHALIAGTFAANNVHASPADILLLALVMERHRRGINSYHLIVHHGRDLGLARESIAEQSYNLSDRFINVARQFSRHHSVGINSEAIRVNLPDAYLQYRKGAARNRLVQSPMLARISQVNDLCRLRAYFPGLACQ